MDLVVVDSFVCRSIHLLNYTAVSSVWVSLKPGTNPEPPGTSPGLTRDTLEYPGLIPWNTPDYKN